MSKFINLKITKIKERYLGRYELRLGKKIIELTELDRRELLNILNEVESADVGIDIMMKYPVMKKKNK